MRFLIGAALIMAASSYAQIPGSLPDSAKSPAAPSEKPSAPPAQAAPASPADSAKASAVAQKPVQDSLQKAPAQSSVPVPAPTLPTGRAAEGTAQVQNASLEGFQLSTESGKEVGEVITTCYFIFTNKPSSYFYEIRKKTQKLVFDFHDTQKGTSPMPSIEQAPITDVTVEQARSNANKDVAGLTPEWHDMTTVTFSLSQIPKISVSEADNVISFTYKWNLDPRKVSHYLLESKKTNWALVGGTSGGGVIVAGGILWYLLFSQHHAPVGPGDLDVADLPLHNRQ